MENPYTDFVHEVWEEFPQLSEWHNLDNDVSILFGINLFYVALNPATFLSADPNLL